MQGDKAEKQQDGQDDLSGEENDIEMEGNFNGEFKEQKQEEDNSEKSEEGEGDFDEEMGTVEDRS